MNKIYTYIVIILFFCAILTPLVVGLLEPDLEISETEKRKLALFPEWSKEKPLVQYFKEVNDYVNDHFGFREDLVRLNNSIIKKLGESPIQTVAIGNDGWIFYKTMDPLTQFAETIRYDLYRSNLTKRANFIKQRQEFAKSNQFNYVFTVVPNKMTLYREMLPARFSFVDLTVSYRLFKDQLLEGTPDIYFDTFSLLARAKEKEDHWVFFKNDTHWNPLGAYHQTIGLIDFFNKQYGYNLDYREHQFSYKSTTRGDVSAFLGLKGQLKSIEPVTDFLPCASRKNIIRVIDGLNSIECGTNDITVLYMGDSFMGRIYPFLAENVGRLYMAKEGTTMRKFKEIIEVSKPDIVIEQVVQRNLPRTLLH